MLEPAQLGARWLRELAVERVAQSPVRGQRLGLAPGAVQGEDEVAVQTLAQRVLGGEAVEPGHGGGVLAEREVGLHGELDRLDAPLLELTDVGLDERGIAEVGQRVGPPQRERVGEQPRCPCRVARGQGLAAGVDQRAEAVDVQLVRPDAQHVRRRARLEERLLRWHVQCATQPRDIDVHGLRRVRRWPVGPQHVDDLLGRHRLVAMEEQRREQLARLPAPDRQRPTVAARLERAEQAELDAVWFRRGATLQSHSCARTAMPPSA